MKKNILTTVLLVIVVGAGGFFAGTKYQQTKRQSFNRQFNGVQEQRGGGNNWMGFRPVSGEIIGADEKSITVKLPDSSSKIVLFSDKTEINKASSGAKEDLKTGEKVMVIGTENSDGSVTAQSIQLNPVQRFAQPILPAGN